MSFFDAYSPASAAAGQSLVALAQPEVAPAQPAAAGQSLAAPTATSAAALSPSFRRYGMPAPAQLAAAAVSLPSAPALIHIKDHFAGPDDLELILPRLAAAVEISIDLETTHLTPWLSAGAPGKTVAMGGGGTLHRYLTEHSCTLNVRPRARVISVETDNGLIFAADLDTLTADQIADLIKAMARPEAVWVGHNFGFDLQWINHAVPGAKPGRIIDTMLLATACRPEIEYEIIERVSGVRATSGVLKDLADTIYQRAAGKINRGADDVGSLPLNLLSMHLLGEKMDKSYQKPHNWMPSFLAAGHLAYCLGDTRAPRLIARRMLNLTGDLKRPISAVLAAIDKHPGGPAYKIFEAVVPRLIQMQRTGLRIDSETAGEYHRVLETATAGAMVTLLDLAPDLLPFKDQLASPAEGLTDELKAAICAAFAQRTGKPMPLTEAGQPSLSAKALSVAFPGEPLVKALSDVSESVKRRKMLAEYLAQVDEHSRIHPLTGIATVTGRTTSQAPNLQNMPVSPEFRACFKAAPGNKIIATDFSAVEMRIAAALAERSYANFVRGGLAIPDWIMKSAPAAGKILAAISGGRPAAALLPAEWPLPAPPIEGSKIEDWAAHYASRYAVVLARMQTAGCGFKPPTVMSDIECMALPAAFRRGLDPHLVTGIQTEARAGRFDLGAYKTAFEYVGALPAEDQKRLKAELKKPRNAAKPLNFGLLYGMSADGLHKSGMSKPYFLDWSLDEAVLARQAWFELYPEIDLWHLQSKLVNRRKAPVFKYGKLVPAASGGKLYTSSTLSNRPTIGSEMRDAANYADQGTAAEIALDAIFQLPAWLAERLVNFIHDELVFEIPGDMAEQAKTEIEATMLAAAEAVLGRFKVPMEVESAIGDCWIH